MLHFGNKIPLKYCKITKMFKSAKDIEIICFRYILIGIFRRVTLKNFVAISQYCNGSLLVECNSILQ